MKKDLFTAILNHQVDFECPATQDAIDVLAAEFGSRARMFETLKSPMFGNADLLEKMLEAWGGKKEASLRRATGKTRDQWIAFLD